MSSDNSSSKTTGQTDHAGQIILRPTGPDDLDRVIALEGDEENAPYIRQWSKEQHLSALSNPNISHQVIENKSSKQMIGYAILIGCEDPDRSLQLKRIVIADKGQGYGRQARSAIPIGDRELALVGAGPGPGGDVDADPERLIGPGRHCERDADLPL